MKSSECFIVFLIAASLSLSACSLAKTIISNRETESSSIDANAARSLSDWFAEDFIRDRKAILRAKLEKALRDSANQQEFNSILDQMIEVYGKPLEFEFKQEELGMRTYSDGTVKQIRKFWYAAKTTKFEKGSHFLIVEVVTDDTVLAVSSFSIVNFPLGVPRHLV